MYLFSIYVLFIKHNSPSTCQQWWTKILSTRYIWVPPQNRTNKETLQTRYSCCRLSQALGGRLCQRSLHTSRHCSTWHDVSRAGQWFLTSLCEECLKYWDSWKTLKAIVCKVLFRGWTHLLDVDWGHNLTAKHEFLHGTRPTGTPLLQWLERTQLCLLLWKPWGAGAGGAETQGMLCRCCSHSSQMGTHGQCRLSLTPTPWIASSANPAHHKAEFQSFLVLSIDIGFTPLTKNTVPWEPDGTFEWSQADIRWTSASGSRHLSFLRGDFYQATLNSFLKGTGKERSENKWG